MRLLVALVVTLLVGCASTPREDALIGAAIDRREQVTGEDLGAVENYQLSRFERGLNGIVAVGTGGAVVLFSPPMLPELDLDSLPEGVQERIETLSLRERVVLFSRSPEALARLIESGTFDSLFPPDESTVSTDESHEGPKPAG